MKLTVFQSQDGDCMLLTGSDGKMVLADGGRAASYSKFVAPFLNAQLTAGNKLDTVYISHIDADHVEGVLRMLDDLVAYEVFDFQQKQGNPGFTKPKTDNPRPMTPKNIWHNAFHDQVPQNAGEITEMLAASAAVLAGATLKKNLDVAAWHRELATSMTQAANISRRIGNKQLKIKLNPQYGGKLMVLKNSAAPPAPIKIGTMKWHIIGPAEKHLKKLRDEWNKWLGTVKGQDAIGKVKAQAAKDEKNLGNSAMEVVGLINRTTLEANLLAEAFLNSEFALKATDTESRDGVTTPNLASLIFMVEETIGGVTKQVLMTGDAHWRDIIDGLEIQKKFDAQGNLHVDVLKVQHHGATANVKPEFLKRVTADHYIFCGISGEHTNPETVVVNNVLDSRLVAKHMGTHAKVNNKFKLWFNGNSANPDASHEDNAQIKKAEDIVASRAAANPGRFDSFFLAAPSFDLTI